jgi:hypothetical protein
MHKELLHLFHQIHDLELEQTSMNIKETTTISPPSLLHSIPKEIRDQYMHHQASYTNIVYEFTSVQRRNIMLFISYLGRKNTEAIGQYIAKCISFMEKYALDTCSHNLTIYLYLTPHRKYLPSDEKTEIDTVHCNTAFTFSCMKTNEIIIFREEEWKKVFVHELMHAFGIDFSGASSETMKDVDNRLKQMFPGLDPKMEDIRLYEAYTETWADILYLMLNNHSLEKGILEEQSWSIFQCVKVLNHHGISYKELLDGSSSKKYFESNTSSFAYYVLRCILLCHLEEFVSWCSKESKELIVFPKDSIKSFLHFLENCFKEKRFVDLIQNLYVKYQEMPKSQRSLGENRTLRMTYHG